MLCVMLSILCFMLYSYVHSVTTQIIICTEVALSTNLLFRVTNVKLREIFLDDIEFHCTIVAQ